MKLVKESNGALTTCINLNPKQIQLVSTEMHKLLPGHSESFMTGLRDEQINRFIQ